MKKIKVGATQINNGFAGQYYLPYSIGLLYAYFKHNSKKTNNYEFNEIIYKRKLLNECVEHLIDRNIVLFSTYVWNVNISLAIAKELKKRDKSKLIIFGGPSVPDNKNNKAENFMRDNPFIDVCIHQEGERTAFKLLSEFPNNNLEETSNISYIKKNVYKNNPNLPRLRNFDEVPSPYLAGIFDNLIIKNPKEKWLASWETNRGCPFSCTYCDWGSATNSKVSRMHLDRIYSELDWFSKHRIEFIFCCDANFGIFPRDYEIAQRAAVNKKKYGYPHVLSVQNTKNARERAYKVQKLLADTGLSKGVTLAMQSVEPHTLETIKRDNISIKDYEELQKKFTLDGIPTYTEFILGLPGDTYDSFANGVSKVIESGQHNRIQFNNLSILPNAEMADLENIKKDKIKTVECPIVNQHGSLDETPSDGILESQQLVISTRSLSFEDWIRTRIYASVSEFLYFNKLAQIPLLMIYYTEKISFRKLFDQFIDAPKEFKMIREIVTSMSLHAKYISKGKSEFIYNKNFLDIYWPPGEYEYIKLSKANKLKDFYIECEELFKNIVRKNETKKILRDSFLLNSNMMIQPFQKKNISVDLNYNIHESYQKILKLELPNIKKGKSNYIIIKDDKCYDNWEDWMREVIWYGYRSGKYLCEVHNLANKKEHKKTLKSENIISSNLIGPYIA